MPTMWSVRLMPIAAAVLGAVAQRPTDTSICDYYTTALLKENTAENQATLLTLIVNTVVIGNYTEPNVGVKVPGILAPGNVNGTDVNLLPYFNGELASTNRGGKKGVSVNFLDGGGAEPLKKNMPANDKKSSQYFLLTHLYQFFGSLLGCTQQGMAGFAAYQADPSMYEVHKFMDLNFAEVTYFIQQVGLTAASFGVAESDITVVANALSTIFNVRCAPPTTVIMAQGPQLQSICIDEETCPLSPNATCPAYEESMPPSNSTGSHSTMTHSASATKTHNGAGSTPTNGGSGSGSGSGSDSDSGNSPSPVPTGGAAVNGLSFAALVGGLAMMLV
ncbi:hypothetical protein HJFPF1_11874 [Paramyrothecium foliicola]|nr:hypothetical protein HJFPF1_11874 [Paramyrothecium foliicola]